MSQNQSPNEGNGSYTTGTQTGGYVLPYDPENYSQKAINRGQRRINYELVAAITTLADALDKMIEKSSPGDSNKFKEVSDLVAAAREIAEHVADIRPPGCESG